jgi:hypothetical protein
MDNNDVNLQHDWDFEVNLSGLTAPTGKGGNVLPTGYYKVKLSDLYINPERKPNRVVIKVTVAEGPFTGSVRTTGFNRPTGPDDKVRYYWRGFAESAGYTPAQLDAGSVKLGVNSFKGRVAHILFTAKNEEANPPVKWEDIDFLAPMEWAQQKQSFDMSGGAAKAEAASTAASGSALGGSEPAIAGGSLGGGSAPSGGDTTKKSELMERLGVLN